MNEKCWLWVWVKYTWLRLVLKLMLLVHPCHCKQQGKKRKWGLDYMGMSQGAIILFIIKLQTMVTITFWWNKSFINCIFGCYNLFFMLSYFGRKRRLLKIWTFGLRISTHQDLTLYWRRKKQNMKEKVFVNVFLLSFCSFVLYL